MIDATMIVARRQLLIAVVVAAAGEGHAVAAQTPVSATLSGTVFDSLLTSRPLAGAEIVLSGVTRRVITDARGQFRIDSVPLGSHEITFSAPTLDSLGVGVPVWTIDVGPRGNARLALATPSSATVHRSLCAAADSSTGLMVGRVRDAVSGAAVAGARVTAAWAEWIWNQGMVRRDRVVESETDAQGSYRLCNVPNDVASAVRVERGPSASGIIAASLDGRRVRFLNLSLSTVDSLVATNASDSAASRQFVGTARLVGTVTTRGRPVAGARLTVLGTTGHEVRSDSAGAFTMVALPGGSQTVQALTIGSAPTRQIVDLVPGTTSRVAIALDPNAVALAPVSVTGLRSKVATNGFEERRRSGLGHFVSREEIDRSRPINISDTFRFFPGVQVTRVQFGSVVTFARSGGFGKHANGCFPQYFVDGSRVYVDVYMPIDDWVRPTEVESVELYPGAAGVPAFARGSDAGCGTIVIWTRRSS